MPTLIGLSAALGVVSFAHISGFGRQQVFYPTVLIFVAHYYVLFTALGGVPGDIAIELIPFGLFSALAVLAFRTNLWLVVLGLAGHGLFDFAYSFLAADDAVPESWPAFCLAFDLAAAAALAGLLILERRHSLKPSIQGIST